MRFLATLCLLGVGLSQIVAAAVPEGLTEVEYDTLYGENIASKDACLAVGPLSSFSLLPLHLD